MTAIRVIFDGKTFIPQQPVALPVESEATVLIDGADVAEREQLAHAIATYYQGGDDADDEAWARATASESHRAWDED